MKKKQLLTLAGLLAVAGVGYYLWKKNQGKRIFANASGVMEIAEGGNCPCDKVLFQQKSDDGKLYNICSDQSACPAE